jgi:hypothetical protein
MYDPLRQTAMTTSISDQTRALLLTGRTVCARAPSRANGIVTWAGVSPPITFAPLNETLNTPEASSFARWTTSSRW